MRSGEGPDPQKVGEPARQPEQARKTGRYPVARSCFETKAGVYLLCTYTQSFGRFCRIWRFTLLNNFATISKENVRVPPSAPTFARVTRERARVGKPASASLHTRSLS